MDKYSLYAAQFLGFKEHFLPKGHHACQGCGVALAVRHVYKALDRYNVAIENANWQIPWSPHLPLDTTSHPNTTTPSLLTILKKGKDEQISAPLMICFDNETSKNGADTTNLLKRIPAIAAAAGYTYAATACPSHPFDLIEKVRTGWERHGAAYIHILCPCPVAWGFEPQYAVRIGRMAVETRIFPLYEIAGGYYRITCEDEYPRPVKEYIKAQKRFAAWSAKKIESFEQDVKAAYDMLIGQCRTSSSQ
ncbi:MAG: hypothetical protein N3B18_07900 [Desulfobacterota bacterium]|nr:hypothetical protein [Thermodesulfobacteriota bacterium]